VTATADPALALTAQPLWPHQAAAFQATRDKPAVLIDGEMGSWEDGCGDCTARV
jgi:hypothetical protein